MNRSLPTVDALNGLLIKNYPDGHLSIAKNGTQVMSGEQLFLLSGEAIVHNLGIGDAVLGVGHPFKVDGISPLLKNITTQAEVENLIEQAIANGVDPFPLLESLEATAAGESVPLGGGGSFFVLDPLYGAGQVNAGYDTRGIDFTVESTERDVPLFERRETTTTTQSAITEPEPPTPEPPAPEPISLTTTNLTFDETFGLQTGSASLLSNLSSSEVDSLTFSAPNATWDSASQTLTANDGSWSLKYNADTQNYEFTQLQAFQHADSTNPDDSMAIPVSVTLTRTDGAVATSTFNITMYDDGPRIETTSQVLNLTVDESNFTANDSANFSESFTVNAGVDGISSIKYALSVTAGSTGLVDALTNEAIVLSINEKGVVEGKTARGGELVFTLSVDSTGTVTLDQLRAVLHSPNTGSDQSATLNSPDLIQLTAAITDNDGDTALASLNIGQALNFKDDGPSINASAAADSLTVDETTLGNDASANFADNFTSSFGEDGAGQIDYSLSVHEGVTGLVDTATNEAVVLSINNDGVVEGRTANSNDLVFTVTVDSAGTVTLDQLRAVVHSPNTGADQPTSLNAADLIQLTATITDKDGDSASAHLDLGQALNFKDDGPSINATAAADSLTVDETTLGNDASANFADNFTSSFGEDGAGQIDYSLSVHEGVTGLVDTATNEAVVLSINNDGVVEGRTATSNDLVFTVSVNGNGTVTLDQLRAVVHSPNTGADQPTSLNAADLIQLTATITDKDGDSASAHLDLGQALNFKDDGPSINATAAADTLTVDETTLGNDASANFADNFTSSFGEDGAGQIDYSLSVHEGVTGLVDTATNEAVVLSINNDGVVEGRTANSNDLVFTVTVDSAGTVTLDQLRAVVHSPNTGADQPTSLNAADLIQLTATITDKDGDSASAHLDLGQALNFKDDGPSINATAAADSLTVDETTLGNDASANFADNFTSSFGEDGAGQIDYSLSVHEGVTGLVDTATNEAVVLSINNDGVVEGRTATSNDLVFTVSVNGNGTVTLDQLRAVVHSPNTGADQPTSLNAADLIQLTATITDKDGDSASAHLDLGQALNFKDDGPSINATTAADTLTVDETTLGNDASANFADNFTSSFGEDGAGQIDYSLSVHEGVTGLVDTATNEAVVLSINNDGVVEGRTANSNDLVFTVTVDSAGTVTLDQLRAVVHSPNTGADQPTSLNAADLIQLTATITDKDGDSASAHLDLGQALNFKDDGPSINATAAADTLTVDETTLGNDASANFADNFTSSFGEDGAGQIDYSLSVHEGVTGLVDTATNEAVVLSINNDGVVEGRTANSNDLVFTVSVNGNGTVTLDQLRAVVHSPNTGADQPTSLNAADLIQLTATITDKDGDSASAHLDLGQALNFKDDGPSINATAAADTLTVDETTLGNDASANFADNFTSSFGEDGAGQIDYSLSVHEGVTGLVDTATNEAVVLSINNDGVVEGRTANSNDLVFTVSVNGNGTVTLDQLRAVVHSPNTGADQPTSLNAADLIQLTATITDKDGDSASAHLDLGQALNFKDDGPSINATTAADTLTVDETTLGNDASANFADNFTSSFGEDGAGQIDYSLSVHEGVTGLVDTATNEAVVLSMNNDGVVEGRTATSNDLVFTVSVNGNGTVTLDQLRAVVHSPNTGADQPISLNAADLIQLTATITDKDGDSASAHLDLGQALNFKDDGPSINATTAADTLTVDETTLGNDASANFADNFNLNYGADGAGNVAYSLGIKAGTTGLVDSATNQAVVLSLNNGVVEGKTTGGALVFTVSVDASGNVTLDQLRAVIHSPNTGPDQTTSLNTADLIRLTATITDKDGDSSSASIDIGQALNFKDDGPSINASAAADSLTVDETTLGNDASANFADNFNLNYGADGAGNVAYSLGIKAGTTGLVDSATNQAVVLSLNNGVVEGKTTGGALVFTVSVDASGNVTLDQLRAVIHSPNTGPDQTTSLNAADLIRLTATITDKDGDSSSASIDIGQALNFKDDGPTINASAATDSLTVDETTLGNDASANFADNFNLNYGADGAGNVAYSLGIKAGTTGLVDSATNQAVVLSLNNGVVEGKTTGGALVFTVSVDASGNVTLDQLRAVIHSPNTGPDQTTSLNTADLIRLTATITDKDGDSSSASIDIGQALNFKDDGPTINASAATDSLTVDETTLGNDASANFADNFNLNYGADGAGNVAYSLGIKAGTTGLVDSATNQAVVLSLNNGVVEGKTTGGALVFKVSVDASGNVTLDQLRAVIHSPNTGPDQTTSLNAADLIRLTATITDKDGDSSSASIDIGQALNFKDDGPTINASAATDSLTVDETTLGNDASANFADNFNLNYGADGAGNVAYSLGIKAGTTGLVDSATNQAVVLSLNNGVVEGKTTGGALVFTVSVDASGNVTLDQLRAVIHSPNTGPDQTTSLNAADLIRLTATITDKDGDSSSASIDIGQALNFKDDGPTINASAAADTLTVDETTLANNASANFADNFNLNYGADGAGNVSYSLGIKAGTTGLVDSATNQAVVLSLNNGVVEGKTTGGALVFKVSVDASGNVTLDQLRAVIHSPNTGPDQTTSLNAADLIRLTATITDKDGDSSSASINLGNAINFKDDAPTAGTLTITADEDDLSVGNKDIVAGDDAQTNLTGTLAHNFGADGVGKIDFAAMNGQTAVVGNETVKYSWNSSNSTLTAYRAGGALGVDDVFKITVNPSTGQYTFVLLAAISHHAVADNNETTNASLTLNYTVTDADNDTATGAMTIVIDDDVPTVITPEHASVGNAAGSTGTFSLDIDSNIHNNIGGDQPGTISFSGIVNGQQATGVINGSEVPLSSGGFPIRLYLVDHDSNVNTPDVVEGWIKGAPGSYGAEEVFRVTLQPDGSYNLSNDTYKVDVFAPIETATSTTLTNLNFSTAGNKAFNYIDVANTSEDLLFSGFVRSSSGSTTTGTVNTNATAIGINNQSMNDGDNLRIDFVNSASVTNSSNNSYNYVDHFDINNFSFNIVQVGGNTQPNSIEVWVRIYNADNDDPAGSNTSTHSQQLADDPQKVITSIQVNNVEINLSSLQSDGNGGYLIRGLNLNDKITVSGDESYNRIEIENAISKTHGVNDSSLNGDSFDIGIFSYNKIVTDIPDVQMDFDVVIKDADGDTSSANLEVNLAQPVCIVGTNVSDTAAANTPYEVGTGTGVITGDGGNDVLVGDTGGVDVTPKSINLVLILDTSGSMADQISFDGSTISRMQALKNAVNNLLNQLTDSDAANVRVNIIQFNTTATTVGTYNLIVNGDPQDSSNEALGQAHSAINNLVAGGGTNYEAAFNQALAWVDSGGALSADNLINQVIFISDGAPTYYLNSSGAVAGTGNTTTQQTVFDPLGVTDSSNEVALLEQKFGPIDAIGINVNETTPVYNPSGTANDLTAKQILDKMEGSNPSSSSNNIHSAEELTQVLSDLSPLKQLNTTGDDTIIGGNGEDILYGDSLYTDHLAALQGLNLFDFANGSGWDVFNELESNSQYNWSREDTLNYINQHSHELAQESLLANNTGRGGGNDYIDAGAGNDRIYGQEGNDTILAGKGADIVDGGSGNNIIDLGADSDQDTLLLNVETLKGHNTIHNFNPQQDILKFEGVLNMDDVGDLDALLDQNNPFTTSNNGQDLNVNFANGAQLTFVGLAANVDVGGLTSIQDLVQQPVVVVNELGS